MIIKRNKDKNSAIRGRLERKDSAEISVNEYHAEKSCYCIKEEKVGVKVVSFYPEVLMTEVMHHNNYSDEEKMNSWYHQSEFIKIRKEARQTVTRLMKQEVEKEEPEQQDSNDDDLCSRGLESYITNEHALKRLGVVKEIRRAVLEKQEMFRRHQNSQYKQGKGQGSIRKNNEGAIAAYCVSFSKHCALEAYDMGLRDRIEAYGIMKNEKKAMKINQKVAQWISFSKFLKKPSGIFRRRNSM